MKVWEQVSHTLGELGVKNGAGDGGRTRDLQLGKRQAQTHTRKEHKENRGFVTLCAMQSLTCPPGLSQFL